MRHILALGLVLVMGIAACSPASDPGGGTTGTTTVTFRLWDDQVEKAYRSSFDAFERANPGIKVDIELVPWDDYWTKFPQDVGSGDMADIFWTNSANFIGYAEAGKLIDIGAELGAQQADWKKSVVDQYTWKGRLWGVPQLWDSIGLFYNRSQVEDAGVDPAKLTWSPGGADTLLPAARKLTKGKRYGFSSSWDLQANVLDFVGSNGGAWQEGDRYAMDSPEAAQAVRYLVDLIHKHKVAPPAADTTPNGDKTRDLFVQGKIALFQSGPYRLKDIQESADFDWAIAPMPEGPKGRVSAVNGIIASGYAETRHKAETLAVLRWLGSEAGQRPIAEGGYAFPGATGAEQAFVDYWKKENVDVTPFVEAADGRVIYPPIGAKAQAGMVAVEEIMKEVFLGRTPVGKGLAKAQEAGNEATSK